MCAFVQGFGAGGGHKKKMEVRDERHFLLMQIKYNSN